MFCVKLKGKYCYSRHQNYCVITERGPGVMSDMNGKYSAVICGVSRSSLQKRYTHNRKIKIRNNNVIFHSDASWLLSWWSFLLI